MNGEASSRTLAFDVDEEATPPGLAVPPQTGGEIVALLADDDLRAPGWPARASVRLGRGWAALGHRVLLVDCDLDEPSLHQVLEVPNGEGVTDAIAFGASLQRVSVEVEEGLRFVPAGTVVADPAAVRADARWESILRRLRADGVVVLLHMPADEGGVAALRDVADRVIRLGSDDEAPVGPDEVRLSPASAATAVPSTLDPAEAGAPSASPAASSGGAEVATDGGSPVPATAPAAASAASAGSAGSAKPAPAGKPARPARGKPRPVKPRLTPWLLLILLLILVGSVVAHWLGVIEIPGVPIPVRAVSWMGAIGPLSG